MLSAHRDMAAAQAFFRSAKAATGTTPDRVTTDGHGSYPRAIRTTLGRRVAHRTSRYENNGLERDHRGVKGRIRCMRGFKSFASAERFCRAYDGLRDSLRPPTRKEKSGEKGPPRGTKAPIHFARVLTTPPPAAPSPRPPAGPPPPPPPPPRHNQHVPAGHRRRLHLRRATAALAILGAA